MSESQVCDDCGSEIPSDAPGGLCPRCLMGAAMEGAKTTLAWGALGSVMEADRARNSGPSPDRLKSTQPSNPRELDRFRRAILDLGLMRKSEFEAFVIGEIGGVQGLARALVKAGKLTAYQASALIQGKSRGLLIGNYFILDKLGAGGMGVVYKARHRRLGRIVALKILLPSLAKDAELLTRFRREVKVAARLSHPNIVSVLDADEDRGVQFMSMEYIEGNDLDRLVRDGGVLPVELALDCAIQAARGLKVAHDQGIVHRDIKPGNLMLDGSGRVRVLDLGLARLIEAANSLGQDSSGGLTQSGVYMGTVDFMAPEQGIDSRRVDHRADIYSLGCTLCYLLTGRAPFDGANVLSRMMAHQVERPRALGISRPEIPEAVNAAYLKMMAKNPVDRPASMREVIGCLEACRTKSVEPDECRSGLREFASTVVMRRSAPNTPASDLLSLKDHGPVDLPIGLDSRFEVPALDEQGKKQLDRPVASTEIVELTPRRSKTVLVKPRPARRRRWIALALGVLALLSAIGVGYLLVARSRSSARTSDPSVFASSGRTSGQEAREGKLATTPRSFTTFDVITVLSTYDVNGLEGSVESIAASADGQRTLIGSWTEHCEVTNVDDFWNGSRRLGTLDGSPGWQGGTPVVAISPDGTLGLVGTSSVLKENLGRFEARQAGIVRFWDLKSIKQRFPMRQPYKGDVTAVAVSTDGLRGLTASQAGDLTLWDLTQGKPIRPIGPGAGTPSAHVMAFFPDGHLAATAGKDRVVHVWDLETGLEKSVWAGHDESITGLAVSPDGRRVVTGSDDGSVILWDVDHDSIAKRFQMPRYDKGVLVAFDSDGNIVAAGKGVDKPTEKPGNLIVWDSQTFAELRRDPRPFARHMAVATLPKGRILTGDRHAMRLWTPRTPEDTAKPPQSTLTTIQKSVDLIALVGRVVPTFSNGEWTIEQGVLVSPRTSAARYQFPCTTPTDYRIDLELESVGDVTRSGIGLVFLVDGRPAELVIDHLGNFGKCTGLEGLDGVPASLSPRSYQGQLLFPSKKAQFSLTVRHHSIELTASGKKLIDWKGDPRRLIPNRRWKVPQPVSPFLATNHSVRFRRLVLTPLTASKP